MLFDSFSLLIFFCVSKLFESLIEIKNEIKSRLHCIDVYDDDCTSLIHKTF